MIAETHHSVQDAEFCADLVRTHDFPRYALTLFTPQEHRRSLIALYAFNVEIVRIRDQVTQPLPGEVRLQWWRDVLEGQARGGAEGNPVAAELLAAISAHDLSRDQLARIVDAHIFDLYDDQMPSLESLCRYCDDTSSRLFALSTRILGDGSEETEHAAHHAGLAQGISELIVGLDRRDMRQQKFLPEDMLRDAGGEPSVEVDPSVPQFHVVLDRLAGEAQSQLDNAIDLLSSVPEQAPRAFLNLALVQRMLQNTSTQDTNAAKPVSHLQILWTLWRASRSRAFRGS